MVMTWYTPTHGLLGSFYGNDVAHSSVVGTEGVDSAD
jgi:hypothetical protein